MNLYRTKLSEKLKESLEAVVPIIAIVLILSFTIAPVPPGILMAFIIGAILLVVGMMFFTLGAEMSMTPMGERIGTRIAQSKRLPVIIGLCFVLGFIITISEPDLQVLAGQVPYRDFTVYLGAGELYSVGGLLLVLGNSFGRSMFATNFCTWFYFELLVLAVCLVVIGTARAARAAALALCSVFFACLLYTSPSPRDS